jgi:molybdate transport system permease protein
MATATWSKASPSPVQRSATSWTLLILGGPLLLLLSLPLIALVTRTAPAAMWQALGEDRTVQAVSLSLYTSTATLLLVILFGTPLAYLLGRRRPPFASLLEVVVHLPTVLPPAVAGIALLMAFGRRGLLGSPLDALGIQIPFTTLAVVLAQTFVAAPFYVTTAAVSLSAVSRELEQAAALDGADGWRTFVHVILPLSWPGLIGGAALCWARALSSARQSSSPAICPDARRPCLWPFIWDSRWI